jgi:hypothetical protein
MNKKSNSTHKSNLRMYLFGFVVFIVFTLITTGILTLHVLLESVTASTIIESSTGQPQISPLTIEQEQESYKHPLQVSSATSSNAQVNAQTITFAQFTEKFGGRDFGFRNSGNFSSFATDVGGSPVNFVYQNIVGLPGELQGTQDARVFFSCQTTAVSFKNVTQVVQPFNDTCTIQIIRVSPTASIIGTGTRTNLLTAIVVNDPQPSVLSGDEGGNSAGYNASTPNQKVTFTSDFVTFSGSSDRNLAMAFASIPNFSLKDNFLDSFTASGAGTFASNSVSYFPLQAGRSLSIVRTNLVGNALTVALQLTTEVGEPGAVALDATINFDRNILSNPTNARSGPGPAGTNGTGTGGAPASTLGNSVREGEYIISSVLPAASGTWGIGSQNIVLVDFTVVPGAVATNLSLSNVGLYSANETLPTTILPSNICINCSQQPVISNIDPPFVANNQSTSVTVKGSGFDPFFSVEILTPEGTIQIPASNTTWDSANQVRFIFSPNTTSSYQAILKIINTNHFGSIRTFQVATLPPAPEITNLLPSTIISNKLTEITIEGNNLPTNATEFSADVTYNNQTIPILLAGRLPVSSNLLKLKFTVNSSANASGILRIRDKFERTTSKSIQIVYQPPPTNSPFKVIGMEVTQGIQDINTSFDKFVEGRPTFVRVHVKDTNPSPGPITFASAELIVKRNDGTFIGHAKNRNSRAKIELSRNPQRNQLNDSFLFQLDEKWLNGTIKLEFNGINNQFSCENSNCNSKTITFLQLPNLEITLVRVSWYGSIVGSKHVPSNKDITAVENSIKSQLPLANIVFKRAEYFMPTSGRPDLSKLLSTMRQIYAPNCANEDPYECGRRAVAILADPLCLSDSTPVGKLGISYSPSPVSVAYMKDCNGFINVASHEIAHSFGREHTDSPEPGEDCSDLDYPKDRTGKISGDQSDNGYFGFDINNFDLYNPSTYELMSYTRKKLWLSEHNANGIIRFLREGRAAPLPKVTQGKCQVRVYPPSTNSNSLSKTETINFNGKAISISGTVSDDMGTGQINSIYVLPTNQTFLASTGSYSIRYENNGQPLATYNFEPGRPLEGTTSVFSLLLPYDELTTRIVLLHNGVELTSKTASSNAPSITVNYPNSSEVLSGSSATVQWTATDADADELRYLIQYSSDFGATWQTLTSDWKTTTFELNLNSISGTNQGLVRIFASDGFYTSQDQSNSTFSVNSHAPQVSITTSSNNSYFVGDQSVVLNGNAFDLEDGQLSGSSFIWSSNINGSLGDGQTLSLSALDLSEGHHTITLTARDSSSEIGTANINIQILRNQASIPVTLKTAPGDLSFIAQVGTVNLSDPQILSVRNDGDGTLNWSASTNQSWIQLSETSGIAPSNVEIRINPTGLAIGNYTGTIAITNSEATNTTQVVNVSLSIVETSQSSLDFTVNLTTDEHDANTADSLCDVDLSTTGLQCTLRAAIEQGNALPANDRVLFNLPANSIITLTTTNGGEIVIDNALEIVGTGANNLIINGGTGTNRIFKNLAPLTISGVTLTGGNGTGAAYLSGIGGAIFANGGSLTLDGVHVTGNSVGGYSGGGVYFGGGAHRIINSTFSSNTAYNCGAFVAESSITIINSTISGNNATGGHGGGFCIQGSNTTITSRNVTITNNIGGSNGGGVNLPVMHREWDSPDMKRSKHNRHK